MNSGGGGSGSNTSELNRLPLGSFPPLLLLPE